MDGDAIDEFESWPDTALTATESANLRKEAIQLEEAHAAQHAATGSRSSGARPHPHTFWVGLEDVGNRAPSCLLERLAGVVSAGGSGHSRGSQLSGMEPLRGPHSHCRAIVLFPSSSTSLALALPSVTRGLPHAIPPPSHG
jgi:hypothetical protein